MTNNSGIGLGEPETVTAQAQSKHGTTDKPPRETSTPSPVLAAQPPTSTHSTSSGSSSSDVLSQSLALTDLIFGIYAIELWTYNETTGKLFNVNLGSSDEETGQGDGGGGLLLKRPPQETDLDNDYSTLEAVNAFRKLTDRSRKDFLPPSPTDPGVGLPGVLWAEQSRSHQRRKVSRMDFLPPSPTNPGVGLPGVLWKEPSWKHHRRGIVGGDSILWRDVRDLANDPHQPYDERLITFAKAGFKLAAGIPFDVNGCRGIVIYFGNPHADSERLRHPTNSIFMNNAAQLIGCAAAIRGPTEQAKAFRKEISHQNWRRLKIKILTIVWFGGALRQNAKQQAGEIDDRRKMTKRQGPIDRLIISYREGIDLKKKYNDLKDSAKSRISRWLQKVQGGSAGIPPSFSYRQCMWSFIGVILTHTILSRVNLLVGTQSDDNLSLILAPLGALTTLQYNLTAAPAAQPRNAFFAQIFAITIAILVGYIPNVEPWFRSALAPAIAIPGMARLGIIHPPAGAAAVVFSSGKVRWEHFGIFMSGVAISIITAVCINNMSDKRQYPTSWYLLSKAKSHFSER